MPKNQDSLNADLARQLSRFRPTLRNTSGKVVPVPEEADVFQFRFEVDGEEYGTVTVSIDGLHKLVVYYGDEIENSPKASQKGDLTWTQLLVRLKQFAYQHQLSFELSDQDSLETDMAKREHTRKLDEGYRAVNKKTSINDSVPTVKVRIQHNRDMNETDQRFRHVEKIFIENSDGERILAPTTKPGVARIYARHIAEGGKPYDERWNHLNSLVEEYTKMAGFVRATRDGQFNESVQKLVTEGVNHYLSLRESLHKLTGKKGYNAYFESWTPPLMEDEIQEDLSDMFMSSSLDPRIESVMPILSKLNKNLSETTLSEVHEFEQWAESILTFENKDEEEADYGDDYQEMVKRVGKKAKEQEKKKQEKVDEAGPAGEPGDQLGATDTVSTGKVLGNKLQSQQGLRGKLVGESETIDAIKRLSGLK